MKKNYALFSILFCMVAMTAAAQPSYRIYNDAKVKITAADALFPWAGGMNKPQFSDIDLDDDGSKDLVVFDRTGNTISTFLNKGTAGQVLYEYAPVYESVFPEMTHWMLLVDYNCDGAEDIFTSHDTGIKTFLADRSSGDLQFIPDVQKIQYEEVGFSFDLGVLVIDIPTIIDVNGDGDMDVLTFNLAGGFVEYYENQSQEEGQPCGGLEMKLVEPCWGKFYESGITKAVNLDSCNVELTSGDNERNAVHAGSTLLAFDENSDGALELVLGDLFFGNLNMLTNGGTSTDAFMIAQDTAFPGYDVPVDLPQFPAAFELDVNNDGLLDFVVAPNAANLGENFKNVWYYENTGSMGNATFEYQSDSFLVSEMIEVGEGAYPVFFDHNADGLMDIIVGNFGYFESSGSYTPGLSLYENRGTATAPEFKLVTRDYAAIGDLDINGLAPTFGDLDSDGDMDMIIGESGGDIHYFANNGGADNPANFVLTTPNYFNIDPGQFATPQLIDLTGDGLLDLVIGERNGNLNFYENTGDAQSPSFAPVPDNDFLGKIDVRSGSLNVGYSAPFILQLPDSSTYTVFVGAFDGRIHQYVFNLDSIYEGAFIKQSAAYAGIDEGERTNMKMADLNNDNILELITGNYRGGVTLYKEGSIVDGIEETAMSFIEFAVFPVPASGVLHGRISNLPTGNRKAWIEMIDVFGNVVYQAAVLHEISIPEGMLASGMYLLSVEIAGRYATRKVMVQD